MMLTVTFRQLHEAGACACRYRRLAKALGGVRRYGADRPIPVLRILETNGLADALWTLKKLVVRHPAAVEFARRCAERARERCVDAAWTNCSIWLQAAEQSQLWFDATGVAYRAQVVSGDLAAECAAQAEILREVLEAAERQEVA